MTSKTQNSIIVALLIVLALIVEHIKSETNNLPRLELHHMAVKGSMLDMSPGEYAEMSK